MLGFYNYTVILTYLGFISGVCGIHLSLTGDPLGGVICLALSGFFDLFDGKVASTMKRTDEEKRFGIQIDSLSDLVCFGVLPGAIGYALGLREKYWVALFALYALAALIRLAYFNVTEETRQQATTERRRSYNGMPVTTVSATLPISYLIGHLTGFRPEFKYIYAGLLALSAFAFLFRRLTVPKPGGKAFWVFCAVLIIMAIAAAVLIFVLK